ncbi:MAG: sulfatase [Acidobacteriota bacterium]
MRYWWALPLLPLAAVLAVVLAQKPKTAVFLISLDTVRADRLGCYGYNQAETPFIDSLAAQGALFENAISCAPFTSASHASILTGVYPPRHGVRFLWKFTERRLRPGVTTLAEMLKENDFRTAAFVSCRPLEKAVYGLDRGFDVYDESFLHAKEETAAHSTVQRRCDETLRACSDWLRTERPSRFFAFIHLFDVHDSDLLPPREFVREFKSRLAASEDYDAYDCEVAWIDRQLGLFFNALETDELLVIITADHGQGMGQHGYVAHGKRLYQEELRVPLIVKARGVPACRVGSFVRTVDILPTITDALGYASLSGIDGRSLLPLIQGNERTDRECYSETLHPLGSRGEALFSIIKDRRKLIYAPQSGLIEYYDLRGDPAELNNLATGGGYDDLLTQLRRFDLSTRFRREAKVDAGTREAMQSLGYVNE